MMLKTLALVVTFALCILAAAPADAQQPGKVPRIGVLWPGASPPGPPRMEAFRQGLRESGYVEGQNIAIELRYTEGGAERLHELAAELVQLNVSVIATFGDLAPRVAQQTTTTIPIVAITDELLIRLTPKHTAGGGARAAERREAQGVWKPPSRQEPGVRSNRNANTSRPPGRACG